jgi:hypothetical protein
MWYLVVKSLLSGVIVMAVSEIARRSPSLGALVASLPLVSVLAMIWLWEETRDGERLALHAGSTFWMVLPSLPMFLVLPALIRHGVGFYIALSMCCALTSILYVIMAWLLNRFGVPF